jgi:peptidoglycan/xylan/chitin deacetylase (PgdA/CDA1 family)
MLRTRRCDNLPMMDKRLSNLHKYQLVLLIFLLIALCACTKPKTHPPSLSATHKTETHKTTPVLEQVKSASLTPASASETIGGKMLYLTFDADMTRKMLKKEKEHKIDKWYSPGLVDYLIQNKIPSTIFSTGMFAEDYPELISKMSSSGLFAIENHTYDHAAFESPCYGLAVLSTDEQKHKEISKTSEIISKLTGHTPTILRHPGLCHNQHDDQLAKEIGLEISDSGTISGDSFIKDSKIVAANILKGAGNNPVIIMHLGGPNAPATEEAVKIAVPKLRAMGYVFGKMQ